MDFSAPSRASEMGPSDSESDIYSSTPTGDYAAQPSKEYLNYLDIKLECIYNIPPDWYDPADAPAYHQHPFRYEVSIATPLGVPIPEDEASEKEFSGAGKHHSLHRGKSSGSSFYHSGTPPPPSRRTDVS